MPALQLGAAKRHDNIELMVSFARSVVTDLIAKDCLSYAYNEDDVEKTEIFVGQEYPIYAQNVKLIILVRDMAPTHTAPLVASGYNTGRTLSDLDSTKINIEYTTFVFLIYARSRYDSKYYATYLSNYLAYYEDDIRKKLSIQDFARRNISQTVPSYVTSFGNMFVTMVTMSLAKLDAWEIGLEPTSSEVHTVNKENIYSVDSDNAKDEKIDVEKET